MATMKRFLHYAGLVFSVVLGLLLGLLVLAQQFAWLLGYGPHFD